MGWLWFIFNSTQQTMDALITQLKSMRPSKRLRSAMSEILYVFENKKFLKAIHAPSDVAREIIE